MPADADPIAQASHTPNIGDAAAQPHCSRAQVPSPDQLDRYQGTTADLALRACSPVPRFHPARATNLHQIPPISESPMLRTDATASECQARMISATKPGASHIGKWLPLGTTPPRLKAERIVSFTKNSQERPVGQRTRQRRLGLVVEPIGGESVSEVPVPRRARV